MKSLKHFIEIRYMKFYGFLINFLHTNRFFVDTIATFNVHGFVSPKEIKQKVALESMTDVYVSLVACTQNQQPFACSTTLLPRQ